MGWDGIGYERGGFLLCFMMLCFALHGVSWIWEMFTIPTILMRNGRILAANMFVLYLNLMGYGLWMEVGDTTLCYDIVLFLSFILCYYILYDYFVYHCCYSVMIVQVQKCEAMTCIYNIYNTDFILVSLGRDQKDEWFLV